MQNSFKLSEEMNNIMNKDPIKLSMYNFHTDDSLHLKQIKSIERSRR